MQKNKPLTKLIILFPFNPLNLRFNRSIRVDVNREMFGFGFGF